MTQPAVDPAVSPAAAPALLDETDKKSLNTVVNQAAAKPHAIAKWVATLRNPAGWAGTGAGALALWALYTGNKGRLTAAMEQSKARQAQEAAEAQRQAAALQKREALAKARQDAYNKLKTEPVVTPTESTALKKASERYVPMDLVNVALLLRNDAVIKTAADVNDFSRPFTDQVMARQKAAADIALREFARQDSRFDAARLAMARGYKLSGAVKVAFEVDDNTARDVVIRTSVKAAELVKQADFVHSIAQDLHKIDNYAQRYVRDMKIKKQAAETKPAFLKSAKFKQAFFRSVKNASEANQVRKQLIVKAAQAANVTVPELVTLLKLAGYSVDNVTVGQTVKPPMKTFKKTLRNPPQVGEQKKAAAVKRAEGEQIKVEPPKVEPPKVEPPVIPLGEQLRIEGMKNPAILQRPEAQEASLQNYLAEVSGGNLEKIRAYNKFKTEMGAYDTVGEIIKLLGNKGKDWISGGIPSPAASAGGIDPTTAAIGGLGALGLGAGGMALLSGGGKKKKDEDEEKDAADREGRTEKKAIFGSALGVLKNYGSTAKDLWRGLHGAEALSPTSLSSKNLIDAGVRTAGGTLGADVGSGISEIGGKKLGLLERMLLTGAGTAGGFFGAPSAGRAIYNGLNKLTGVNSAGKLKTAPRQLKGREVIPTADGKGVLIRDS